MRILVNKFAVVKYPSPQFNNIQNELTKLHIICCSKIKIVQK